MVHEITDLTIEEVSAVDVPANKSAKVVLLKRDGIMDPSKKSILKQLLDAFGITKADVSNLATELNKSEDVDMTDPEVTKRLDELAAKVKGLEVTKALSLELAKAETVDEIAAVEKKLSELDKADADEFRESLDAKKKKAEKGAEVAKSEAFAKSLPEALRKSYDAMDDDTKVEFRKGFTPAAADGVTKVLESLVAKNESLEKKLEALSKTAEDSIIKSELADAGVTSDEVTKAYKTLRSTDPAAAEVMLKTLKSQNAQLKTAGLFKTAGHDEQGEATAEDRMAKAAEELRKTDANLTKEQAIAKVLENDPSLYTDYTAQKGA